MPTPTVRSGPGTGPGMGVIDGYEIFDGSLPVFVKYRIGADPFLAVG
jgi:hypothetical protein